MAEQLWVRLDQLSHLVWKGVASEQVLRFWTGSASGQLLYNREFFHPLHSAGILWLALIPLALLVEGSRAALRGGGAAVRRWWHSMRGRAHSTALSPAVVALAFACLSLSVNAVLQWRIPLTHALPYGETLLIAAVGAYALRRLGIGYWLLALGAVLTRQVYYFVESARTSVLRLPTLDAHGMHFWGTCAVIILLGFVLSSELRKSEAGEA